MATARANYFLAVGLFLGLSISCGHKSGPDLLVRKVDDFGKNWRFRLDGVQNAYQPQFDDSGWRTLRLPHDWSIEGKFSKDNPATPGGGALPGGVGWYRKTFTLLPADSNRKIFIDFDGVYMNSEVWINGQYLGKRPYGYSSFRYDLTPYLHFGERNVLAVRVDNSKQPNSRWYTGSGIYRNVRLIKTGKVYVDHWGTYVTTPQVSSEKALAKLKIKIKNSLPENIDARIKTTVFNDQHRKITQAVIQQSLPGGEITEISQELKLKKPLLWSPENPRLYTAITTIEQNNRVMDDYKTVFGVRTIRFNPDKGFFLNDEPLKIRGLCNHHDLGCLGAAVNVRAIERQLKILKRMGANAIRTSHNPPAPELLDLCDKMGFLVMDEAFDMWQKGKTQFDYALYWDEWHRRDLEDMVLRDRNHPSVFVWSIGNEVLEQWDKNDNNGVVIAKELASIVKQLDDTRPVTAACTDADPENPLIRSGALDLIGYNYSHEKYSKFSQQYPGKKFIATETTSALATRGHYDMPSDSVRIWPVRWDIPFKDGNPDNTCSAYDNCHVPWGSTNEEVWRIIKAHDFLSGLFIWTGFDYLGEPTPYDWPSRSSYFGIVDLAGFPKDAYYMYQSEWTDIPVLHIFPHWNWQPGDTVDVWAYTNCDEVELFLNGASMGVKQKREDDLHLMWRLAYVPGSLKAIGQMNNNEVLTQVVRTAGEPAAVVLEADRPQINADGRDLAFITVKVIDREGTTVPDADPLIHFSLKGEGQIIGVDNGLQTSHEPFKANYRKAFNGMCLVVVQSGEKPGNISLTAKSESLKPFTLEIKTI